MFKRLLAKPQPLPKLSPREKAQAVLNAVQAEVLTMLRTQRHLLGSNPSERRAALQQVADSFLTSDWCPEGLTREDIEVIDPWLMRGLVYAINDGRGLQGYATRLYELYTTLATPAPVSQVQELPYPGSFPTGRRSGPRRRV